MTTKIVSEKALEIISYVKNSQSSTFNKDELAGHFMTNERTIREAFYILRDQGIDNIAKPRGCFTIIRDGAKVSHDERVKEAHRYMKTARTSMRRAWRAYNNLTPEEQMKLNGIMESDNINL